MNNKQAMDFLEETKQYGSQLGLISITRLMEKLGNVQDQIPVIHIGGTNGKGSTGAFIASTFLEAGYRVGRFSTPDVFCYEEEFMINGLPIEKDTLAAIFTKVARACSLLTDEGAPHPTRFEVETAAAFLWFFEEQVDVALIEVGMGGETDATNIIRHPLISVLTSISFDHMGFLGNTLVEIAQVKAGIIKEDAPVVTARQPEEVMQVIRKKCQQIQVPCICADVYAVLKQKPAERKSLQKFDWQFSDAKAPVPIQLGLAGSFQIENAVCALKALEVLKTRYARLTNTVIQEGLRHTRWPGRFEQIGTAPDFYLDGAHNEDAVKKLRKTLDTDFTGCKIIYIIGILADKAYETMTDLMFSPGDIVFTVTPPENPRALDGRTLAEYLVKKGVQAQYVPDMNSVVKAAVVQANAQQAMVLAFGSLSYLGALREAYRLIYE